MDYFNNDSGKNSNLSNSEESKPIIEDVSGASKVQPKRKKTFIFLSVFAVIFAIGGFLYFNSDVFVSEEVDLFRKMEGEQQVFVNNLTLRQDPDAKSSKIEVFPIGTRLFFEENELPKTDDKQRVWRKVRVIHPVYGWERPDERFPYPYEGWMAIEECGVPWIEDSLTTANLLRILGNEDAGRLISSSYRHGLVEFFQQNNYFGEWIVYGSDEKDKMENVMLTNLGNSDDDCNGEKQKDFIALIESQNSGDQKLIVMSTDRAGKSRVVHESTEEAIDGMRNLKSAELRAFKRKYNTDVGEGILINMGKYDQKVLFIEKGSVQIVEF